MLVLVIEGGWRENAIRRTLDALRIADLVTQPSNGELLVTLPNTKTADAYIVEKRLRRALPEASCGITAYRLGKAAETLLERARTAVSKWPSS